MKRKKQPNIPCPFCGTLYFTSEQARDCADKDIKEHRPKHLQLLNSKLKK